MLNVCVYESRDNQPNCSRDNCYMLNVCVYSPVIISPVVESCYMLNVCVYCPVISAL